MTATPGATAVAAAHAATTSLTTIQSRSNAPATSAATASVSVPASATTALSARGLLPAPRAPRRWPARAQQARLRYRPRPGCSARHARGGSRRRGVEHGGERLGRAAVDAEEQRLAEGRVRCAGRSGGQPDERILTHAANPCTKRSPAPGPPRTKRRAGAFAPAPSSRTQGQAGSVFGCGSSYSRGCPWRVRNGSSPCSSRSCFFFLKFSHLPPCGGPDVVSCDVMTTRAGNRSGRA